MSTNPSNLFTSSGIAPKKLFWKKFMEKSGTFIAILVLNFAFFLLLSTVVIWHLVASRIEAPMAFVKVQAPPPQPPKPPAKGGEGAKSSLDPTVTVAPPQASIASVVVSPNATASFSMQTVDIPVSNVLPSFSAQPSGSGLGEGTSGGGLAHSNPFGDSVESGVPGLIGELYDLKQTPESKPTPIMNSAAEGLKVLREYVKTWDQSILDRYYKSPGQLEATQMFIPTRHSEEATKAFNVADFRETDCQGNIAGRGQANAGIARNILIPFDARLSRSSLLEFSAKLLA